MCEISLWSDQTRATIFFMEFGRIFRHWDVCLLWPCHHHIDGLVQHGDVMKWKNFPRYWPFVRGVHRSTVNSPHKGQWRGALIFSLICAWINDWVNNCEVSDLRRRGAHYDVIVMRQPLSPLLRPQSYCSLAQSHRYVRVRQWRKWIFTKFYFHQIHPVRTPW